MNTDDQDLENELKPVRKVRPQEQLINPTPGTRGKEWDEWDKSIGGTFGKLLTKPKTTK